MIIKELREEHNLKQADIANVLKITRGLYSQYEIADKIIPLRHLNTLSNYFNVSIDFLLGLSIQKVYSNSKNEIDMDTLSLRLKALRKEHNLTQNKLANILNTSHSVISSYEKKHTLILTSFLYTICKTYNISADYLLGKTIKPKHL